MIKAFTLFSTIILVFIFSVISVNLYELKSINSLNIQNQYKYIQAKNHLNFLEVYIKSLNDFESIDSIDKLQIENSKFEIIALFKKLSETKYEIEMFVKAIDFNVRVYKTIVLENKL